MDSATRSRARALPPLRRAVDRPGESTSGSLRGVGAQRRGLPNEAIVAGEQGQADPGRPGRPDQPERVGAYEPAKRAGRLGIAPSGERHGPVRSKRSSPLIQGIGKQHHSGRWCQSRQGRRIGAGHVATEIPRSDLEIVAAQQIPAAKIGWPMSLRWRGRLPRHQALHTLEDDQDDDQQEECLDPAGQARESSHRCGRVESEGLVFLGPTDLTAQP